MLICINIVGDIIAGGETVIVNLLHHMAILGGENRYIIFKLASTDLRLPAGPNIRIVSVPSFWGRAIVLRVFAEQILIPILSVRHRVSILYCSQNFVPILYPGKMILHFQNAATFDNFDGKNRIKDWYRRLMYRLSAKRASHIISVSDSLKKKIVAHIGVPEAKVTTIHNGVDDAFFFLDGQESPAKPEKERYILFVSAFRPNKKIDQLIRAYALLVKQYNVSEELLIVGSGSAGMIAQLRDLAKQEKVDSRIRWLGYVPHQQLPNVYHGARIFTFPSVCESFGLPVIEAMASGIPVSVSDLDIMREITGGYAVYYDPYDHHLIAHAIHKMLVDQQKREAMAAKGRDFVRRFSWSTSAKSLLQVFRKIASRNHRYITVKTQ